MNSSGGKVENHRTAKVIGDLPSELIFYILSFLSLKDLSQASQVSTRFRIIVEDCTSIIRGHVRGETWREQYQWCNNQRSMRKEAITLFNQHKYKESLANLLKFEIISDSPQTIAGFLEHNLMQGTLSKKAVGEYVTHKDSSAVLDAYLDKLDFQKLDLTDALRKIFSGFEVSGVQYLGPLMEKFAKRFLKQRPENTVFINSVSVANLSFSIYVVLYSEDGIKRQTPLPLRRFIDNNHGINDGKDFPPGFLESIYERIMHAGLNSITPFPTSEPPPKPINIWTMVKTGWLYKQGMDILRMWKKRWFLLGGNKTLYYYRKPGEQPLGEVKLVDLQISRVAGRKPGFKLQSLSGPLKKTAHTLREHVYLCTEIEEDRDSWVTAIRHNSEYCLVEESTTFVSPHRASEERRGVKVVNLPEEKRHKSAPEKKPTAVFTSPLKMQHDEATNGNNPNRYFGVPFEQLVEREDSMVPMLVQKSVEYLMEKALDEEGILRLSGSLTVMNEMRQDIEKGVINFTGRDPHAVAGIFKSFLRELPDPIVSKDVNDGVAAVLAFGDGQEVIDEIRNIIHSLPKPNFYLFRYIVWFLTHIASHSDQNKMHMNNLLRVITPTLHCVPGIISIPMEHYSFIFDEVDNTSSASSYHSETPIDVEQPAESEQSLFPIVEIPLSEFEEQEEVETQVEQEDNPSEDTSKEGQEKPEKLKDRKKKKEKRDKKPEDENDEEKDKQQKKSKKHKKHGHKKEKPKPVEFELPPLTPRNKKVVILDGEEAIMEQEENGDDEEYILVPKEGQASDKPVFELVLKSDKQTTSPAPTISKAIPDSVRHARRKKSRRKDYMKDGQHAEGSKEETPDVNDSIEHSN